MYCYSAYQLCLHSEIPLSGLPSANGEPDVIVRLKDSKEHPAPDLSNPAQDIRGRLAGIGKCRISDGKFITITPFEGVTHEMIDPNVLGGCMSVILRQRGFLVLHASSVAVQGNVVAFLGHSGWGKSTLAAALHTHGHSVITDDVLAISLEDIENPIVVPSFPQCKLTPQAASALGKDPASLEFLYAHSSKRAYHFQTGFQQEQLPLQSIYLLSKGDSHSIIPLGFMDAFAYLVSHTRAMDVLRDNQSLKVHFQQCTQLLKQVSYYRFTRKPGLEELPDLVRMVEEHVQEPSI
ncbi:hypothetical protein D0962_31165 [Leptolyngbyaceae cyanobacterium CCMR0082]|uniref:HPr kinase/phosphorylase C-terminal domain-containing protein n=2 Tax=Adonisia turfae TaxID=2950184 RepID=A0A6M0SGQ7_9CYAN|nr:hypothetical protein [Adonisia turfae]NEZ56135.1 hypothetical protein [Adonisia turfae CCMR0081]NEZ67163.1 hypothetical protein [Adonisia turfae CCMR0082]